MSPTDIAREYRASPGGTNAARNITGRRNHIFLADGQARRRTDLTQLFRASGAPLVPVT